MIPISKNILLPLPRTNAFFVDGIEEFEKILLDVNETKLAFDNNETCFYVRERDRFGEYQPTKIYFYQNFAERVQNIEKEKFVEKCRKVGLDELKIKIAIMFFIENKKPQEVWLWLLENKIKDIEWDSVKQMKYRLKLKLFPELVHHKVYKK